MRKIREVVENMKREEFRLKSAHDGLDLGVSLRIPEGEPRGILQVVHGMAEHRQRYHDFMDFAAEHGYVAIIHDHRGHGESAGNEDNYGFFGKNGVDGLINDTFQVTEYVKNRFPGLKLTLFGHSMGSLVVRSYMKKYDRSVTSLVVCGSPSKRLGASAGKLIAKFLQIFLSERHRSNFLNKMAFGGYLKNFPEAKSPSAWIASNEAVVEAFDADPRDGFVFTLNGFEALFGLVKRTYSKKGWGMKNPGAPIFFIAGANDPCIISKQDFEKAVNFMRERGYTDVESKLYPGMRHEILNETGKQEVWQDVIDWMERKV